MFKKPFVVLDLETTGVESKKDDIIEAAIIRYENGAEVSRYNSLIKLRRPLPKIITVITGITDRELEEKGQEKDVVFAEVARMLSGAYVVGHNIRFDIGFLEKKRVRLDIPGAIDTMTLAQIFYPEAASYSLESLSMDLGIEHINKHRAMGDVLATLELFQALCGKAEELPGEVLEEIRQHVSLSPWKGGVVFGEIRQSADSRLRGNDTGECGNGNSDFPIAESVEGVRRALSVQEILGEEGILKKFWEEYEPRPQQVQMAENTLNAFEQGYHLICEAPTGVGKSLAYLIPAAEIAIKNKSKVVISTHTINLQDQLYDKDVPLLNRIYREGTQNAGFKAALLKGRSHYLCLRRLAQFKNRPRFSEEEIILLTKILVWQRLTKTGDSGEVHLSKSEALIWHFELCSDKRFCTPQKCQSYGECYVHKARRLAEEADLIIVNHALLCADLLSEGSLLPDYHYLVIDEAHNFEEAATDAFGQELKQENFLLPLRSIQGHLERVKSRYDGTLFGSELSSKLLDQSLGSLSGVQGGLDNFFSLLAYFVNRHVQDSGYMENLLLDQSILGTEEWVNLSASADETLRNLREWLKSLREFLTSFQLLSGADSADAEELATEIQQESESLGEQMAALTSFFEDGPNRDHIRWMTSDTQGNVSINLAPFLPGAQLKEKLYGKKKSMLLTSATLGVQLRPKDDEPAPHPFSYLRSMLSLDERFEELVIGSPFDFESQAYILLPSDALSVVHPKSSDQLIPFFGELIRSVGGNMLSLFMSYRMIETLYLALVEVLKNDGVRLLAQRITGGRNKILKAYLSDPDHSVLFGTSSFWEGIDIKGDALTTLVIHKLPFDMPNDPVFKARNELFQNGFYEYALPRAVLRFRQGFGRLIRSTTDYGVMAVLDNRLFTKDYGQLFLDALPERIPTDKASLNEIPGKVKEWLGLKRS